MGSEADINALPEMDLHAFDVGNLSDRYVQLNVYYCSFAKVGYVNHTGTYRFHGSAELDHVRMFCQTKTTVFDVMLWLAVALGLPGNIIALLTISSMPSSTSTFYISLLSFSDIVALCARATDSLFFRYKLQYTTELCEFMQFITNYSMTYSNWVLVFICFERFITIRFPLKKSIIFTLRRARYISLALAIILLPFYLAFIVLTEARNGICVPSSSTEYFYRKIFSHVVKALYAFIPATLLLIFTILVISELKKHQRTRRSMLSIHTPPSTSRSRNCRSTKLVSSSRKRQVESEALGRSITIMMVFTALVFLLLTIPLCIIYTIVLSKKRHRQSNVDDARNEFLWTVAGALNLMSHAINFYIYFLSARKFRRHLYSLFVKRKRAIPVKLSLHSRSTRT